MKTDQESSNEEKRAPISSFGVLGARLTWAMFGPLALVVLAWAIGSRRQGWLTGLDAPYAAVVILMMLGRWVEHRSGTATTLTGEPATAAQCRRYLVLLPIVAVAAWIVAKVLGNYVPA
jgi:hypothetical protein